MSEFCGDAFLADIYSKPQLSGTLDQSLASDRVVRGGGYTSEPRYCRSASREQRQPDLRRHNNMALWYGFRVALDFRPGDNRGLQPSTLSGTSSRTSVKPATNATVNTVVAKEQDGAALSESPLRAIADGSPEVQLKKHGLTKSGSYFVLASETEILEKFEKVRPLIASMAQRFNMLAQALRSEVLLADAEDYRKEIGERIDEANVMLSKMPNGPRANSEQKLEYQAAQDFVSGITQERDNASRVVDARRTQQVPAGRKEELVKDFKAKWSDFLKAADELTPLFDEAFREYRRLKDDRAVKDALAALSRSTKATALLGPSRNLQNAVETIKSARRTYAPETAAPKKKTRPANTPASASPKKKGQATKR